MSNISETNEQSFEELIEKALVGSTREERSKDANVDDQRPMENQFYWGLPKDMDNNLAIDMRRLWSFLEATQADELRKYKGGDIRRDLPNRINNIINQFGVLRVLRDKVKIGVDCEFSLFYPRPTAADSEEAHRKFLTNQFSVTRQLTFSQKHPGYEIDMAIFVNGIPLFTIELKNPWTYQTAKYNGQKQYREERDPSETLLKFGRCLAHFTMDKDEVYFTTKLAKEKTYFMPFNKGLPDGQGAGNPINPNGYATSYMWEHVLQKDTIADIISNYSLFDFGKPKKDDRGRTIQVPHVLKNAKKLIFPRYHQLDVVSKLIEDVSVNGVGKTYLIEHSAGSGKSNSLTWLAYKLIDVCPTTMSARRAKALDLKLFNSVIVVTDRRILDSQISTNIKAFGKDPNTVAHADSSSQLKTAIQDGKKIIITTIQKFPYISDSIQDVSDHNIAIIIDEAHSSQSGIAADKMNATVDKNKGEETEEDTEDLIMKLIRERKMSENCSYFAFTATPKRETLERFGTKHEDGHFYPYHLYSMKQAIEEGFILDVLTNYTTFHSYYEVRKSIADNPKYNNKRSQKLLRGMVEREPHTIAEKAEVMLTHFDTKVYRSHKLKGEAKALVATKDIECAIRYYQAFQKLKKDRSLPYNILIAFSGEKEVDGVKYTEEGINGFKETALPEEFEKDDNRILVVAKKYLTGFDQPKLCVMYIDKPLDGVLAVQALSRLNRSAPELGKRSEDLFILDFYNTADSMKESFDPYYTVTSLSGPTDVNILHDLRSTLLEMDVFNENDINAFAELYFNGAGGEELAPILDSVAERFIRGMDWDDDAKADFKMKCKQFVRVYSRMAAIMDFESVEWEKTYWFLRLLIPELKMDKKDENLKELLKEVDLSTYGLTRTALNQHIDLAAETAIIDPAKAIMVNANNDDTKDPLDQILKDFNDRFFKGWKAAPEDQKTKLVNIAKAVAEDQDYKDLVMGNADTAQANKKQDEIIDRMVRRGKRGDLSFYKEYLQNEDFKNGIHAMIGKILENGSYLYQR